MPVDTFESHEMLEVIEDRETEQPNTFFRDRFFPDQRFSTSPKIFFDVIDHEDRLAPFVSPLVQGKVMEHRGYETKSFSPAYVKPKGVIDPAKHLGNRRPGEPIGGTLSLAARRDALVVETLEEHDDAIANREEVMAAEALRLGQVTVDGEGYPTTVVSFGRDASLRVVLAGAATWDNAGVDANADIESWADLVFGLSGSQTPNVYFGAAAWAAYFDLLTADQKNDLFDSRRGSRSRIELGPQLPDYIKFRGSVGEFDFFQVGLKFQDEDGGTIDLMPTDEVMLASESGLLGLRMYGAILDPGADYQAVRSYPKMWVEEDPAREILMTQSAPLVVPRRPNASFGAKVLP